MTTSTNSNAKNLETLGWDDLIARKRGLSEKLKSLTEKIIEMDKKQFPDFNQNIRDQKNCLNELSEKSRQTRAEIDSHNFRLASVSERITQSKNFLSTIESRIPIEKESGLQDSIQHNQRLIDRKEFRTEHEKSAILSQIREIAMKLEAIKATNTVRQQLLILNKESDNVSNSISILNDEHESLRTKIIDTNKLLDKLYDSRRKLSADRDFSLEEYDKVIIEFDAVNARLDSMADMRKKQREEYGSRIPRDTLFKVREVAKKKLESGSKLSFDELRLLYEDKDH